MIPKADMQRVQKMHHRLRESIASSMSDLTPMSPDDAFAFSSALISEAVGIYAHLFHGPGNQNEQVMADCLRDMCRAASKHFPEIHPETDIGLQEDWDNRN